MTEDGRAKIREYVETSQDLIGDYAARLERIRALHGSDFDGVCVECRKPHPCPTALMTVGGAP